MLYLHTEQYAAFTPCSNCHNLEMTTCDVVFGAFHILGLEMMLFCGNTLQWSGGTAVT